MHWKPGAGVCVVLTSGGYPGKFENCKRIVGLTAVGQFTGVKVLHAGTKLVGNTVVTSGGRVIGMTAAAPALDRAPAPRYEASPRIHFSGMHSLKYIRRHPTHPTATRD